MEDRIPMQGALPRLQRRIADVIRRYRKAGKWSQESFADYIGMHRAQYGFIERAKRDLRLSTLDRVAHGLGQPLWVILREVEEAPRNAVDPAVERQASPDRDAR